MRQNCEPIADSLACVRCGYDLRTLSLEQRCPECGTPVCVTLDAPLARSKISRTCAILAWIAIAAGAVLPLVYAAGVIYTRRDTTVYAPGFSRAAFLQISPGMSRANVETLIGRPLNCFRTESPDGHIQRSDARLVDCEACFEATKCRVEGTFVMSYTTRGDHGWTYGVVYHEDGTVKQTYHYDDRH